MSSPEYESFEINDDDIRNEFNLNRSSHVQTKEEATYGIFVSSKKSRIIEDASSDNIEFVTGTVFNPVEDDVYSIKDSDDECEPENIKQHKNMQCTEDTFETMKSSTYNSRTYGIGMKLLQKMGHVPGRGLGKNLQGIVNPIKVSARQGKSALGYYKEDKIVTQDTFDKYDEQMQSDNVLKKNVVTIKPWHKDYKPNDKDAGDVLKNNEPFENNINYEIYGDKVVDMTGESAKVISGNESCLIFRYGCLSFKSNVHSADYTGKNDRLLNAIRNMYVKMRNEVESFKQKDVSLNANLNKLKSEYDLSRENVNDTVTAISNIKKMIASIKEYKMELSNCADNDAKIIFCGNFIKKMFIEHVSYLKFINYRQIPPILLYPLIDAHLCHWNILEAPTMYYDIFFQLYENWKIEKSPLNTCYDELVWNIFFKKFTETIRTWNPVVYSEPVFILVRDYKNIISEPIYDHMVNDYILPQLLNYIHNWNPTLDKVPIHEWTIIWKDILDAPQMNQIEELIQQKLANILKNWRPHDHSAKNILKPWIGIFDPRNVYSFILTNIFPKLYQEMNRFEINPQNQKMDKWENVVIWNDVMPISLLSKIMVECFFPKWLLVLGGWLKVKNANIKQIAKWFSLWKNEFPEILAKDQSVKDNFNRAIQLMNNNIPEPSRTSNYPSSSNYAQINPCITATSAKELVEKKGYEHNIVFVPLVDKKYHNTPLYRFGRFTIYFDRNVIFVRIGNDQYSPASIDELIGRTM
ncbi:hypothetical protein A3Q56_01705 [Intoshia linei]|uniref:G-patch domain-containing protein n=1 Tax=Intoshia linei TaxID=1819745 RepID=A0A177BAI9_9BILA|nr:hypothetical protein A3Q56_01705 [Intoshia linei]